MRFSIRDFSKAVLAEESLLVIFGEEYAARRRWRS
jgi:hypothetical protein